MQAKAVKPKVENVIGDTLSGDRKKNALAFVAFVKSLRMSPQWVPRNSWTLKYKSKRVGYIRIHAETGEWSLWLFSQYDKHFQALVSTEAAEIHEFILKNIVYCCGCGRCAPGKNMVLLGKEFKNICATPTIRVRNPTGIFYGFATRLIALRRDAIADNRVPKVCYIAIKDRK